MTFLILLGHAGFAALFGWTLLSLRPAERSEAETLLLSVLVGMYVETLSVATLMFLGVSLVAAGIATAAVMAALIGTSFYLRRLRFASFSVARPKLYEWAVLAAIAEKIVFAVWQLGRTHTYFDDALTHWSGRARSLYGGFNWSFDPASPVFLGQYIGSSNYPLQTVIWRALSAELNGGWNDILSRADGLIFFVVLLGTIWLAVQRFSKMRWLAAAAAFIVAAVPLHAWHAAAGYNDIAVEVFVAAALAAILRKEWLIAGVLAAGAVWSKNDALVMYLPAAPARTAQPNTQLHRMPLVGPVTSALQSNCGASECHPIWLLCCPGLMPRP